MKLERDGLEYSLRSNMAMNRNWFHLVNIIINISFPVFYISLYIIYIPYIRVFLQPKLEMTSFRNY